ncbi:MAG TPA: protein kinase [bacterium]|nr:protein kinase [bacterium]
MIGQSIAHYQIIRKLGSGGMGEVFLAQDSRLERQVALKFLSENLTKDPEARARLLREAKAASKLNHPNIMTIHAVESINDRDFIVMEYVEGQDLAAYLKSRALSTEDKLTLGIQIAEGLGRAHAAGVIHRDVKPSNVLVDQDGRPRLLDFGLATFEGAARLTQTGSTVGTAAYMSPEQASGRDCDHRSDLFSFGVVLYEMLADRLPFQGAHNAALMYAIVNDEPQPLARYLTGVSEELQRIVSKCLAKHPAERYQSAADLIADLRRLVRTSSSGSPQAVARKKMLAVLPFENLGPADDEYFADGITEEIISRLAAVAEIGVISRTSVMQYKGTKKPIREIGGELGVDYVLEGTVRWGKAAQGPSRVRITPQLIRVNEDTHMWSDRYDRVLEDIFDVQSDIAEKVTEQLNVKLGDPERRAIEAKPTENLDAYHAYLRGYEYITNPDYTAENHRLAIQMFERAVSFDPAFAQAHACLSIAHSGLYFFGGDPTPERAEKARQTVATALSLKPDDALTAIANGFYLYRCRIDYEDALDEFKRAVRLRPNHALAIFLIAAIQRRLGRPAEALEGIKAAQKLDPASIQYITEAGITCFLLRRFDEAESYLNQSIRLAPDQYNAYTWYAMLRLFAYGDLPGARRRLESMGERGLEEAFIEWFEVLLAERALAPVLAHIERLPGHEYVDQTWYYPKPLLYAEAHALLGQPDEAKEFFRQAHVQLMRDPIAAADVRRRLALARVLVGLGECEVALAAAREAMAENPLAKDALLSSTFDEIYAILLAVAGEHDQALAILERLLSTPTWVSSGYLMRSPRWDALRQHPEFQRLLNLPPKVF